MSIIFDRFIKNSLCGLFLVLLRDARQYAISIHIAVSPCGAKAEMTELEGVRLPSVVRSLRTTDGKCTRSNATVCAFAPPKKMWCSTPHYDPIYRDAPSPPVVQRHTWRDWKTCVCRLWCEPFAPYTVNARVQMPLCEPLHHRGRYGVQRTITTHVDPGVGSELTPSTEVMYFAASSFSYALKIDQWSLLQ